MKAIEDLFRRVDQLPLVDKDNGARLPTEFVLIKNDDTRRLHHTFPDVATAAGRLKHRKTNAAFRNILIQIFRNVWPDIVDAVDVSEYDDDDSEFHIRDALSNIVERFPFAVATLKAIEEHCFKGASLTNSEMRAAIEAYKIPNSATMSESYAHNKRLDDLRDQWKAVEQQPGVDRTSGERFDDLLNMLDMRSRNDRVGLNYQAFIIEHRKLQVSTKTLPLLIKNLKKWVHEQILHRQATQKGGTTVISANATDTGCPMHPGANHTAADCRGLKAKNQGASSNNKTYVHKNKHQGKTSQFKKYNGKGKEKSFDAGRVHFDQDWQSTRKSLSRFFILQEKLQPSKQDERTPTSWRITRRSTDGRLQGKEIRPSEIQEVQGAPSLLHEARHREHNRSSRKHVRERSKRGRPSERSVWRTRVRPAQSLRSALCFSRQNWYSRRSPSRREPSSGRRDDSDL
jgi:hypothetical protein